MSKSFCLTINNPTQDDLCGFESSVFTYTIYQIESGECGTRHAQGFAICRRRERIAAIKQIFPRAHIQVARGSAAANIAYCSKQETRISEPVEYGCRPLEGQGSRNDIESFRDAIREGKDDLTLLDLFPEMVAKYPRFINFVRCAIVRKRTTKPVVKVYWGGSGRGKTRLAVGDDPTSVYVVSKPDTGRPLWWDGYVGQSTVVIDDFYGWIPWSFILQLIDRYPFQVEIKGGKMNFNSTNIIFTSNVHPNCWYKNVPNHDMTPLLRRIDEIKEF